MNPRVRIGIDARELLGDSTGVGLYLGELLRRWVLRADAWQRLFVLYAPEPIPIPLPDSAVELRVVGSGRGTWWEQTALRPAARRDSLNAFFAPAYTAPLGLGVPLVLTIHDVSFLAHPEWFRPRERVRRRWLTRRAASSAAVILTDSEFSRREIESHLPGSADRIRVIPPGVTARVRSPATDVPRQRLVLYVGSIFNRRRVPDLIEAFARATQAMEAKLVIVGANRSYPPQDLAASARTHGVAARVEVRDYVRDDELVALYSRAAVFAFLSEYEGFGLTPLEALAFGVPIVVLDTAVAREVYGDAAIYVAAGDISGTAAVLERLLQNPAAAHAALSYAPAVLSRYSWDRAAAETLEEIDRMACS